MEKLAEILLQGMIRARARGEMDIIFAFEANVPGSNPGERTNRP